MKRLHAVLILAIGVIFFLLLVYGLASVIAVSADLRATRDPYIKAILEDSLEVAIIWSVISGVLFSGYLLLVTFSKRRERP